MLLRISIIFILTIIACDSFGSFTATSHTNESELISETEDNRQQWIGHYIGNAVTHIASNNVTRHNIPYEVVISESGSNKILIESQNITNPEEIPYYVASIKVEPGTGRTILFSDTSGDVKGEVNITLSGNQLLGTIYEFRKLTDGSYSLNWWARISVVRID
jgi:hypothetical protein